MIAASANDLYTAIESLTVPGILIGQRAIADGDEAALMPAEAAAFASSVAKVRRASGAARIVARALLAQLGAPHAAIVRSASGAPAWPPGITGSLAHDDATAVAAVARQRDVWSVGIDVEPALPLPGDLLDMVATPRERAFIGGDLVRARLLFCAKEAVYKAVHPLDGTFLDHHDVEVDLASEQAVVRSGRRARVRYSVANNIVCLALVPRPVI
jgi:4'-phosphopantetheinyl transferase EntD